MAELGASPRAARLRGFALSAPRLLMSWEDWFTLLPALAVYLSLAIAIQQAEWVREFPSLAPAVIGGLVVGLVAARTGASPLLVQPAALLLCLGLLTLTAQPYGEGASLVERVDDIVIRMREWVTVVREDDVSNDNLPFVLLVHTLGVAGAYLAAWAIFRWRNAWLAVVPAGAGLLAIIATTDGQPSGAFLLFSIGALLLVARLHLQRSQAGWDHQRVEYPEWLSAQAAQLTLALTIVMVVVAWQMPLGTQAAATERAISAVTDPIERRVEPLARLFHDILGGGGNFHKFGSTMPVRGDVGLGVRVLFEVRGDYPRLVRGASYDEYTGTGWKATDRDAQQVNAGEAITAGIQGRLYRDRVVTELDVQVFDDEDALFSVGTPLGANIDSVVDLPETFPGDIERVRSREGLDGGDRYRVLGSVSVASPAQLRADSTQYPQWVRERYLQLPDDLPPRVAEESALAVTGTANPYDLAVAIEAYLRTFERDLRVPAAPPRRDVVDFLLFDLQRGYFDYFSTAMTVMLRTQGVPARIAVGYVLDPEDLEAGTFSVRKNDAYSWVEVFFPTYGWVDFNPSNDLSLLGEGIGILTGGSSSEIPEIPLDILPLEALSGEDAGAALEALLTPIETDDGGGLPLAVVWSLGGALVVAAVVALGTRLYWLWGLRGLWGLPRQWGGLERLAGWVGLEADEAESASRWGDRLGKALGCEEEAAALSDAFEEARYGPPDLERTSADDTRVAYRALRNALAARLLGRKPARDEDAAEDMAEPESEPGPETESASSGPN